MKIMASRFMSWQIDGGKSRNSDRFYFLGLQNHCEPWLQPRNFKKTHAPWKNNCDKPRQCIKKQKHHFADKDLSSQSYGSSVVMYNMRIGPLRRLSTEEVMLLNCGAGDDSWEPFGQQGDQTSQV